MVPDSGAEVPVLFRAPALSPGATAQVAGMSGDGRIARVTAIQKLRVGSVTFRDLRAYAVDRDDEHADGLLPLHTFGSVSFAAGGGCLVVRR